MEKTRFNSQHQLKPLSELESLEWLRKLTLESEMPADVMWRLAQAIRAVDFRLQAHERALIAAYNATEAPARGLVRCEHCGVQEGELHTIACPTQRVS